MSRASAAVNAARPLVRRGAATPELGQTVDVEFAVLGPLVVRHDGCDVTLSGRLQRALLGVLLLRADAVMSRDELTDALWGEHPGGRAEANLHVVVHRLRRRLPDSGRLTAESGGYRLRIRPGELDAERFEALLDEGHALLATDPALAVQRIRAAADLWRGEPYSGLDVPALNAEAQRLTERRLGGLTDLYDAELTRGRHAAVVADLVEEVRQHPLHERLHALLMTALYRSGRQGDALAAYQRARDVLVEELGQDPGPELREIERQILAGKPVELAVEQPSLPVPRQLPGAVLGFTGRGDPLATLDSLLTEPLDGRTRSTVATVTGTGGVGKTALALEWAHRVRERFPDGQLYVDLHGFGPEPPRSAGDTLAGFLRALGVDGTSIPAETDERAARFRTLVSGKHLLIVLDNAANAEQVRPLLPGGTTCRVLVTSRDSLVGLIARDGARRILLDRLSQVDALALLEQLVGPRVRAERDASSELVARCDCLPLAVRIAGELMNAHPDRGVAELAAELADQQSALDVLDAGGDEATAVRSVFSWSYQRLGTEAARAFRLLGLHPGYDLDLRAGAALLGADLTDTRSRLRTLLRAHLLDEVAGRYRMHDLLRAYALDRSRLVDDAAEQDAALDRVCDHYATVAPHAVRDDPDWLEAERTNLAMMARRAADTGRSSVPIGLASTLRPYLKQGSHHDEALVIHGAALDAARDQDDVVAEADAHRFLGATHRYLGRLSDAYEHMRLAYHCYRRAGTDSQQMLQLNNLGATCTWLGHYEEALDHLGRAHDLARGLGDAGRFAEAAALTYLGQAHLYLGEPERALAYATEALERDVGPSRRHLGDAATMAGLACERLGRHEEARRHLERAWTIALGEGTILPQTYLSSLATVYWHLGRPEDAYDHAHRCLAIARRRNIRILEPDVRITLGEIYRLDGSYRAALSEFQRALVLARAGNLPYQQAHAELLIGDALDGQGKPDKARRHWQAAQGIWAKVGSADVEWAASRLAAG